MLMLWISLLRAHITAVLFIGSAIELYANQVLGHALFQNAPHPVLFFVAGLILERSKPIIPVFRRSSKKYSDVVLAQKLLVNVNLFGRPVWLPSPKNEESLKLKRFSPVMAVVHVVMLCASFPFIVNEVGWVDGMIAFIIVTFGCISFIDALCGNSGGYAVAWFAVATKASRQLSSHTVAQLGREMFFDALLFLLVYTIWSAFRFLLLHERSPLRDRVKTKFDLLCLRQSLSLPFLPFQRFVHDGPGVVNDIKTTTEIWKETVSFLLSKARFAIIDITDLSGGGGLMWEVEECNRKGVRMLIICHVDDVQNQFPILRDMILKDLVFPVDFHNRKFLQSEAMDQGIFHILTTYGGDPKMDAYMVGRGIAVLSRHISLSSYLKDLLSRATKFE